MGKLLAGLVIIGAFSVVGCDDATEVGCDFFENDNCWKQGVAEANACIDTSTDTGTLSGDRLTCTYPGGETITFDDPVPMDINDDYLWRFEITTNGSSCATFREFDDGGVSLTTARGEFVEEIAGFEVRMTCPSGDTFKIDAFDALDCGFGVLPGFSWSTGGTGASFSLIGTDMNETLFSCDMAVSAQ
jgi:hypothetical protein